MYGFGLSELRENRKSAGRKTVYGHRKVKNFMRAQDWAIYKYFSLLLRL